MLKNLIAILILFVGFINNAEAKSITSLTTIIAFEHNEWTEVQNENGIKIFFSKVEIGEKTFLKIKIENTLLPLVKYKWSLFKDAKPIINYKEAINQKSFIYFDRENLIPINKQDKYKNFSISLNLN